MPFTLTMPKLSPTMEGGAVAKWHKKPGEFVEAGDLLLEVSTDKATVEYNALDSGWLRKIIIPEGKEAVINQPIAIFTEEKEESIEGFQPETPQAASQEKSREAAPQTGPQEKAVEAAPQTGPQKKTVEASTQTAQAAEPAQQIAYSERIKASPLARKLAKEENVDLSQIKGSGPGGRIMKRDLAKASAQPKVKGMEIPVGAFEEESLTPMRKVISQRLLEAKSTIPHFYVSMKVNAQPIVDLRDQLKQLETKVTYNDIVVKACAIALKQHPNVNSGFNAQNNTLIRFKTIDISVAVSVQGGLITPIVRYADTKPLSEISLEIKELVARAKDGKLESQEYKGGSFTVSNLGMFGVSEFTAIINPPQGAILAVSGILETPIVKNGFVVPGLEMTLTLSSDHRVIDGVASAEFLNTLKKLIENPIMLLLE